MKNLWLLPALGSAAFLAFSLRVMAVHGPFGFVEVHTNGAWGGQVGTDLVLSATVALFFAAPYAKKHGIKPAPWVVLTLLTGSIGLLAYTARILYARQVGVAEGATAATPNPSP